VKWYTLLSRIERHVCLRFREVPRVSFHSNMSYNLLLLHGVTPIDLFPEEMLSRLYFYRSVDIRSWEAFSELLTVPLETGIYYRRLQRQRRRSLNYIRGPIDCVRFRHQRHGVFTDNYKALPKVLQKCFLRSIPFISNIWLVSANRSTRKAKSKRVELWFVGHDLDNVNSLWNNWTETRWTIPVWRRINNVFS
jgi:hypothetical protein